MPSLLITGGRVIDPASGHDAIADIAVADGRIAAIGQSLPRSPADRTINAEGRLVTPGLIDPHVHLREPGQEHKETLATGGAAAIAGGFTTICCMPNTSPALDSPEMVTFIEARAAQTSPCRIFVVAAATKGRKGEELAEISLMARAGAVGFSDDGDGIASAGVMARALAAVKTTGRAFMQHCQEPTLTRGASMHAGEISTRLGLTGWPRVAEELMIERDIRLNRGIAGGGCRYHVQHISSAGSVDLIRRARAEGQPVTAEAAPHHLLLTHEAIEQGGAGVPPAVKPAYFTNAKMNPPLREQSDVDALVKAVADGTITILATDHAPHTADEKSLPFEEAPFGIVGLETALALYAKALIDPGAITWPRLIALMTIEPARLCGLDAQGLGQLKVGGPADITIINPDHEWTIHAAAFKSKSRNMPFEGWKVKGKAEGVIVGGEPRP